MQKGGLPPTYNARNELVTITTAGVVNADGDDEGSYTTSYGYDQEGNRVTITDARGNATTYEQQSNQLAFETNAGQASSTPMTPTQSDLGGAGVQ